MDGMHLRIDVVNGLRVFCVCQLWDVACHLEGTKRATTTVVLTENYDVVRRGQAWLAVVRSLIGVCGRC